MTPIHLAAKNGCTDMVQTLIEKNANVNCKDKVWYILCFFVNNLNYFSLIVLLCILDVMQKRVILIL